jgi:UDP-N-acetylmuramoylalanine--D-glutamate ligase
MRIAILGYGVEGKSVEQYFGEKAEITVFDEGQGDKFDTESLSGFDMVFRSPSVQVGRVQGDNLTSVTRYFFEHCSAKIVGVTGTKGKGTTCSLIAGICQAAGRRVHLVGNIGVPALDVLDDVRPDDLVVYELSSFQLWDLDRSPHVAVLTHMEVDHLDVHKDKFEYWLAKQNIMKWQTAEDYVIFENDNAIVASVMGMAPDESNKIAYPTGKFDDLLDALVIPGEHNRRNAEAAILACWCLGITDKDVVKKGLAGFDGLPHRLKLVGEYGGVKFYDDSISTTPGSTIAAIRAFSEPKILILGGSRKGADFRELAEEVSRANVRQVVLIGVSADEIEAMLAEVGYKNIVNLGMDTTMSNVVKITTELAETDDVVILSPACASFDMFKSYADRGEQFMAAVQALGDGGKQ